MTSIIKCLALFHLVFFLMPAEAGNAGKAGGEAPPPMREIPGITDKDQFPRACVDCHINMPDADMDKRIGTQMKQWVEEVEPGFLARVQAFAPEGAALKGRHPAVADMLEDIPASCLKCHGKGSRLAPPLSNMLHGIHLTGSGDNHYLTIFQGECTHCHKYNKATGEFSIPSGPEK